jgi:hypothetical protein
VSSATWNGSTIGISYGGTGATSALSGFNDLSPLTTQGDLLYYSGGNNARLAMNTNATRYLANTGTSNTPQWDLVNLSNGVTGTLGAANGGTGATSALSGFNNLSPLTTQGDLLYYTGSNNARLAKNTSATRYLANTGTSNNPQWDLVNLSNGVTGTLGVANGGTGNTTQFTPGSILFAGSNGVYQQSNANLFYDSTHSYMGLGVNSSLTAPLVISSSINASAAGSGSLIITGNSNKERIEIDSYGGTSTSPVFQGKNIGGSSGSPTVTALNTTICSIAGAGYDTASTSNKATMDLKADTTWSAGNNGTRIEWSVTPNSSTTRNVVMTLHNTGNLSIGGATAPNMFNVGSSNQFQVNSSGVPVKNNNISLEGFGFPSQIDTTSSGANNANISATNLSNTGTNGMYNVWVYIFCTTSDASGASVTAKIAWDNNTKSATSSSVALSSTNNYATLSIPIHNNPVSGSSIRYSTAVTGTPTSAKYEIDITVVRTW